MLAGEKEIASYYKNKKLKKRIRKQLSDKRGKLLLAVCDFSDIPLALGDSVCLLWNADVYRKKNDLEGMDVAFVWHDGDAAWNLPYIEEDNFRYYFHNLALEAVRLFPSIGNVFVFSNRSDFHDFYDNNYGNYHLIYPEDYDYMYPLEHRDDRAACYWYRASVPAVRENPGLLNLSVPQESSKLVKQWLSRFVYPDVPVTITLRECEPAHRASNIEEWQKLIDYYCGSDIKFIVLRDHSKLYEEPVLFGENVLYWDAPVLSLSMRAALYEKCALNLFVLNGPAMLAHLNHGAKYIVFKFHIKYSKGVSEPFAIERIFCVKSPQNFIGANKYQRIVWSPDTFKVMKEQTDEMIKVLKKDKLWR